VDHNESSPSNGGTIADLDPVVSALLHAETFTRGQVAWLIAEAMRWGYEARVNEENAAWPPPEIFTLGRWYTQAEERAKADAAARLPRPGDFRGREGQTDSRVSA
jgi:hypothetical protein